MVNIISTTATTSTFPGTKCDAACGVVVSIIDVMVFNYGVSFFQLVTLTSNYDVFTSLLYSLKHSLKSVTLLFDDLAPKSNALTPFLDVLIVKCFPTF